MIYLHITKAIKKTKKIALFLADFRFRAEGKKGHEPSQAEKPLAQALTRASSARTHH